MPKKKPQKPSGPQGPNPIFGPEQPQRPTRKSLPSTPVMAPAQKPSLTRQQKENVENLRNKLMRIASRGGNVDVEFIKRTNGADRLMSSVFPIPPYTSPTGRTRSWNPLTYDLLQAFDTAKGKFRMINLATLKNVDENPPNPKGTDEPEDKGPPETPAEKETYQGPAGPTTGLGPSGMFLPTMGSMPLNSYMKANYPWASPPHGTPSTSANNQVISPTNSGRIVKPEVGPQGERETGPQGERETGPQGERETGPQGERKTAQQMEGLEAMIAKLKREMDAALQAPRVEGSVISGLTDKEAMIRDLVKRIRRTPAGRVFRTSNTMNAIHFTCKTNFASPFGAGISSSRLAAMLNAARKGRTRVIRKPQYPPTPKPTFPLSVTEKAPTLELAKKTFPRAQEMLKRAKEVGKPELSVIEKPPTAEMMLNPGRQQQVKHIMGLKGKYPWFKGFEPLKGFEGTNFAAEDEPFEEILIKKKDPFWVRTLKDAKAGNKGAKRLLTRGLLGDSELPFKMSPTLRGALAKHLQERVGQSAYDKKIMSAASLPKSEWANLPQSEKNFYRKTYKSDVPQRQGINLAALKKGYAAAVGRADPIEAFRTAYRAKAGKARLAEQDLLKGFDKTGPVFRPEFGRATSRSRPGAQLKRTGSSAAHLARLLGKSKGISPTVPAVKGAQLEGILKDLRGFRKNYPFGSVSQRLREREPARPLERQVRRPLGRQAARPDIVRISSQMPKQAPQMPKSRPGRIPSTPIRRRRELLRQASGGSGSLGRRELGEPRMPKPIGISRPALTPGQSRARKLIGPSARVSLADKNVNREARMPQSIGKRKLGVTFPGVARIL